MHIHARTLLQCFRLFTALMLVVWATQRSLAVDLIWTNTAGGNWATAANWFPNQVPAATDNVIITNAGNYTVTNSATVTIASIVLGFDTDTNPPVSFPQLRHTAGTLTVTNFTVATNAIVAMSSALTIANTLAGAGLIDQTASTLWLLNTGAINRYNLSGGEQRGGTLTVTNFNWTAGNLNSDGAGQKLIVPSGGTLNYSGSAERYLSYYTPPGRGLDNYGIWNWTGSGNLRGQVGTIVNNYGTVNVSTNAQFNWGGSGGAGPTWNNFGTFTKTAGTDFFYFNQTALNNSGSLNINSGSLSIYSTTYSGSGSINVSGPQLQFYASTATNNGPISVGAGTLLTVDAGGTLSFGPSSSLNVPSTNNLRFNSGTTYLNTTNVTAPSAWIAGGTLIQMTNNSLPAINQSAGIWQLAVPCNLAAYNLTNGELRGRDLTVTNYNWYAGDMNSRAPGEAAGGAADRTIIPAGGVLNILGTSDRGFSYYTGTGRGLDNFGTINWSAPIQLRGNNGAVFNNYSQINITADAPNVQFDWYGGGSLPTFNNYGTVTRTSGSSIFYLDSIYFNNAGTVNIQTGTFSIYASTATNLAAGSIQMAAGTILQSEAGSTFTLGPGSTVAHPDYNGIRLISGSAYIATTNFTTPAFWISGATVYQQTNIAVGTINESAGTLQLTVPCTLNTYNFTNGELRGRDLTVTNCNWYAGDMNSRAPGESASGGADRTIIPAGGILNILGTADRGFSYYAGTGRGLDNFGTINWSAANLLRGNNGAIFNNYGNVNVTGNSPNVQYYWYGSGALPVWNNFGTLTRSTGTSTFYINSAYLNNSGTINIQSGAFSIYGSTLTNSTGQINVSAGSIFQSEASGVVVLGSASRLTAPTADSIRFGGASAAIETTNIVSPTFWQQAGTLYQRTNIVVSTINESGGAIQFDTPCFLNQLNQTNGDVQGRNLTVTNWNWYAGNHYRGTPGVNLNDDRTIIPPGGTMNLLGAATRYLTYYSAAGPSRTLDNYGTINWSGNALLYSYGQVNNYGSVTVSAVGTPQYIVANASVPPTWNNYGTFTRNADTAFYFNGCYLNNSGTLDVQQGTLSIYGSTFTNSIGLVNVGAAGVFQSESSSAITLAAASQIIAPTANSIRLSGATAAFETTNVISPTLWLQAGTLYQRTNIVVSTINMSGGALQLDVPSFLNLLNQTNGDVQGRNFTVTNWNWIAGNHYRGTPGINTTDDRTIIPAGGVMNLTGPATRYLTYYSGTGPSRTLDNYGTVNWTGTAVLGSYGQFNNYGSVDVSASGTAQYYGPNGSVPPFWNNYGTFTRSAGSLFYFQNGYVNNSGTMNLQAGTVSIYAATLTNSTGNINVSSGALFQSESGSVIALNGPSQITAPTADSIRLGGASAIIETTNIVSPTLWLQTGTLYQRTNITVATINESGGALQLDVPAFLNQLNQTNGDVQGRTLTITNWNWFAGSHIRGTPGINTNDDRTIIPAGGVMNLLSATARALTYYSAFGPSRALDNYGTVNWSGAAVISSYGPFNNYGSVNVSANGTAQYYNPNASVPSFWNNYGTFTRSVGPLFYFQNGYVNNSGTMNVQAGTVSIYAATFTNQSGGNVLAQPGTVLANDASSSSFYEAGSSLGCADTNALQINSGNVTLRTTAITAPSLWINGGTLNQNTNNAVPVINESAGVWKLNVPASVSTYNLTNGELRGANLAVDKFNWLGGSLNSDGPGSNLVTVASALNIVGAAAKSLSYWTQPGRSLINNGTATWGGANISGSGGATFQNNGSLTLTNDIGFVWSGSGNVSVFQNNGTFTKSAGAGVATFSSTTFTNSGAIAINSGGLTVGGPFVQTAGSSYLGTNFTASSSVSVLAGSLTGKGTIAGAYYNNGVVNPGASPGFINGASFTNTAAAVYNVEIGGNTDPGTNYDQLRFSAPVTLDGTLNVSLYNNYAMILSNRFTVLTTSGRSGTFANVIPPPGVTLNTIYSTTNVVLEVIGLTNAPLQVLTNPVSQTIWTPDPVTFFATVSGVTPITFQWQFNGTNILNATNTSYTIPAVAVTNDGLYTLQIADGAGGTTNVSATLTVIPFGNTIWWTNTLGGNWSVPANWVPNRVPVATNNVIIVSNGTYTVNVDVPAALSNLTVGIIGATGTPTVNLINGQSLTVNGNTSWETNAVLALNGLLQMNGGSNSMRGRLEWQLGTLSGAGRTLIGTNATLVFYGSLNQKNIVTNILENYGTFTYGSDSFGNAQGLRFAGGAQLTNYPSGVISIGTAAYQYAGSQTPRSYFMNYGTINANSANVFSPTYISIDFINYGTLQDNGYVYLSRGTNYGTFSYGNTLCEVSVFGDESTGEYFSFENGTSLAGTYPLLAVGGYAQWNTTAVHPGKVTVASGSGGASFANPEFRILKNYTQTGETIIYKGRWTQANPLLTADLNVMSDGLYNNFHTFVITNAGTLNVNNLSHTVRNLANSGTITVRSNLSLAGSSYTYGGGSITIQKTAAFSGGTVESQSVENSGTNTVTGSMAFTGGTRYHNATGARTWFSGGTFDTGPASVSNDGLLDGFGGISALNVTNRATVLANDSLNRNLGLGSFVQESGRTELSPGVVSGTLDIRGGLLTGTNTITGTLRNAAQFAPGKPFGLLSVTGNFTNTAAGTHFLPIQGVAPGVGFPQTRVSGTSVLAGTLYVNFTNGFNPAPGNLFTAMVFTARSGTFDAIVNDTYGLEAFYTPTTLVLRAENLLPNVNLVVQGGSTQLVCQTFRITATATDPDGVVTNLIIRIDGGTIASSSGGNLNGVPLKTSADSDFPTQLSLVAQATDDRSGVRSAVLPINIYNYSATNVLFLGGVRSNDFKLCMVGEPGRNYDVYASTNLSTTNWLNIGTMTQSNGTWRYVDPFTLTNRPLRFYRAKQLP